MTGSLPPGWASDLAVLRLTGGQVTERTDHLVVRSPANPDHHWGNFVLVTDPGAVDDAERWLAVFDEEHPTAAHRAVGLVRAPDPAPWAALGLEVEHEDVLATDRLPDLRPLPEAYAARELTSDDDWEQHVRLALAENARTGGHPADEHERFERARTRERRTAAAAGHVAWFGATTGDGELVADLGIVDCGAGLARFQAVGTDPAHRGRGLAGHLLGHAARWAAARGCGRWVILTEPDNPAGRLYRSLGFAATTPSAQAYRSAGFPSPS